MVKKFNPRRLIILMSTAGIVSFSHNAMSAAFMLWEQDAASIGNYHAGVAAIADDASTNWYNAAGLTRIKCQELVVGADPILTDFRFSGNVTNHALVNPETGLFGVTEPATVQGGNFNLVPFGHYAAPITDRVAFGLSVDVPFGLKTDYGNNTFASYAATLTELQVFDVSPSLAFKVGDKLSIGLGPDWQKLYAYLNVKVGGASPEFNTFSNNDGNSSAWGYHIGALYEFTPCTRMGLNYRSRVVHHVNGSSTFQGKLANGFDVGGTQRSNNFNADATLPATTSLGFFHAPNPCWDLLAHVSYTQWDVFQRLVLKNVAGLTGDIETMDLTPTNNLTVIIPENYRNTWNASVGANYHPNSQWILRTGLGWDQSPAVNSARNLQLPDSNRIGLGLGGHYQMSKTLGFDMGWTHIFAKDTTVNVSQAFGPEVVTTNGSVSAGADVYGVGIKWDMT